MEIVILVFIVSYILERDRKEAERKAKLEAAKKKKKGLLRRMFEGYAESCERDKRDSERFWNDVDKYLN